ncbi:MAG: hypothetical protein Ct9H90mP11_01880 [Acidimicrobiales bacterium]|nr:MAG: hypothetical protein Ct9H90mP11_01880 [Acidimicrobiales bacterium]
MDDRALEEQYDILKIVIRSSEPKNFASGSDSGVIPPMCGVMRVKHGLQRTLSHSPDPISTMIIGVTWS